jgi:flagellar biogenesis protein FliO
MKSLALYSLPVAALLLPVAALAGAAEPVAVSGGAGPVLPSLIRLIGGFVLVIVLVYACAIFFKKMSRRRNTGGTRAMNVLDILPLGAKSRLISVKIGCRVYVVGAGESQVNAITSMDEDEYRSLTDEDQAEVVPFRERLKKLARK